MDFAICIYLPGKIYYKLQYNFWQYRRHICRTISGRLYPENKNGKDHVIFDRRREVASVPALRSGHMACCYPDLFSPRDIAGKEIKEKNLFLNTTRMRNRENFRLQCGSPPGFSDIKTIAAPADPLSAFAAIL